MSVTSTESVAAFEADVCALIAELAPAGLTDVHDWNSRPHTGHRFRERLTAYEHPLFQEWDRRCQQQRLVCPAWPEEFGGHGWTGLQVALFQRALFRAGLPRVHRGLAEDLVGPTVIMHGTDEQKARLLPPIIAGKDLYCQGFSEPDYGSDLAGVRTRGVVDGEYLIITGQKIWTSSANRANMMFLLCRTDPDAAKHAGLTFAILPFGADNGIEVRMIRAMSGPAEFGQEFLTEARTPLSNVIGGLGNGWKVTMTALGVERGFNLPVLALQFLKEFDELVDLARAAGRADDPRVREQLASAFSHAAIIKFFGDRALADSVVGRNPGAAVSVVKLFWSEYHKRVTEFALELGGRKSLVRPEGSNYATNPWQDTFLAARADSIYAGTSQIQRNVIAERTLGLPR